MTSHADAAELGRKLAQAHRVIGYLLDQAGMTGGEGARALDYFASDTFDPDFMPWPRPAPEGLRPEELNSGNDG